MTVTIILGVLLVLVFAALFASSSFYRKHRDSLQNIICEKDVELKKANQTIESEKNKVALRDLDLKKTKEELYVSQQKLRTIEEELCVSQQKLRTIEENTVEIQTEVPENCSAHQAISKLLMSSTKTVKAYKLCGKRTTENGTVWSLKILK